MNTDTKFEIEWRKELIARLLAPRGVLERKVAREEQKRLDRAMVISAYESAEDAHEAYGYGEISYEEYVTIAARFDGTDTPARTLSVIEAALEELLDFMRRLSNDVRDLEWGEKSEEEKERIRASGEAYRAELQARKEGVPL